MARQQQWCTAGNESRILRVSHAVPTLFVLAAITLFSLGNAAPCHGGWPWTSSPEQEAYEQSRDEYKAVHESVAATKERVEKAKKATDMLVEELEAEINRLKRAGDAVPPKMKEAAAKWKNAQETLGRSQELLANFGDYSDKVTAAMDVYDEIVEVRKRMEEDQKILGPLGGQLDALGSIMKKADSIPILGEAIAKYGEITVKTVDALRQVANTIDKNKNQGTIGTGASDTNEKARIFRQFMHQHPKELIAVNYEPSTPPYLYVPEDEARGGASVLWDEEAKQFSLVPKGIPVKDIFKMSLLIDKRLEAPELIMHMQEWKKGGARRLEVGRAMHVLMNKLRNGPFVSVVSQVARDDHEDLFNLLRNPRLFEARYVYDRQTHDQLHRDLKAMHERLMAEGERGKPYAAAIRNFAKKYKLDIAFADPKAVESKKAEKKNAGKEEPSFLENLLDAVATELKKAPSPSQKSATPPPQPAPAKSAPAPAAAPAKPAVKPGAVVGTCAECRQSGLDCACGKAACRCCAPGDSNCNAFDL